MDASNNREQQRSLARFRLSRSKNSRRRSLSSLDRLFLLPSPPASARPRGRQLARQGKPTTVAHHLEFLKRGAGCLRTTRRGGGEEVWKREEKREVRAKKAEFFFPPFLSRFTVFQPPPPPLLLKTRTLSPTSSSPNSYHTIWPRPQKPPWSLRPPRGPRRLLPSLRRASRPRSPCRWSRRWRASTPMVKRQRHSFVFFVECAPLRADVLCSLWRRACVHVTYPARCKSEQSKSIQASSATRWRLERKNSNRIGATRQHRDFFLTTPMLFLSLPTHLNSPIQTRPRQSSATPRSGPRSWTLSRASPRFSRGLPVRREGERFCN